MTAVIGKYKDLQKFTVCQISHNDHMETGLSSFQIGANL